MLHRRDGHRVARVRQLPEHLDALGLDLAQLLGELGVDAARQRFVTWAWDKEKGFWENWLDFWCPQPTHLYVTDTGRLQTGLIKFLFGGSCS